MLLTIGKRDRQIRFTHNALADLEQEARMGIRQFLANEMGFAFVRLLLWAGLKDSERGLTLDRAGQLVAVYCRKVEDGGNGGTLQGLAEALLRAVVESGVFGDPEAGEDEIASPAGELDDLEGEAKASV